MTNGQIPETGPELRALRIEGELSLVTVAEGLGVNRTMLSNWERGMAMPADVPARYRKLVQELTAARAAKVRERCRKPRRAEA